MSKGKGLKYEWVDSFQSERGPSPTVRHVLLCLFTHMNKDGSSCFPGARMIATETGLAKSTVLRAISDAEAGGWVRVEKKRGGRRGGVFHHYWPSIPGSGRTARPVTNPEVVVERDQLDTKAVAERDQYQNESGRAHVGSGRTNGLEVVAQRDLSSSGSIPMGSSHGNSPALKKELSGEVPQGWEVPNDLAASDQLFTHLTDAERTWAYQSMGIDGPVMPIANHTDLALLPAEQLHRLRYHVAARLDVAVAS